MSDSSAAVGTSPIFNQRGCETGSSTTVAVASKARAIARHVVGALGAAYRKG